jgi:hypothetical protein
MIRVLVAHLIVQHFLPLRDSEGDDTAVQGHADGTRTERLLLVSVHLQQGDEEMVNLQTWVGFSGPTMSYFCLHVTCASIFRHTDR